MVFFLLLVLVLVVVIPVVTVAVLALRARPKGEPPQADPIRSIEEIVNRARVDIDAACIGCIREAEHIFLGRG